MSNISNYRIKEDIYRYFGKRISDGEFATIMSKPSDQYAAWHQELSGDAVSGLRVECLHYIRCWGNGGGSYSTQTSIEDFLFDVDTDEPKKLADIILHAVEMSGESPLGSTVLTMDIINDSLAELNYRNQEQ